MSYRALGDLSGYELSTIQDSLGLCKAELRDLIVGNIGVAAFYYLLGSRLLMCMQFDRLVSAEMGKALGDRLVRLLDEEFPSGLCLPLKSEEIAAMERRLPILLNFKEMPESGLTNLARAILSRVESDCIKSK